MKRHSGFIYSDSLHSLTNVLVHVPVKVFTNLKVCIRGHTQFHMVMCIILLSWYFTGKTKKSEMADEVSWIYS